MQHEPTRQLPRQRRDGELVLDGQAELGETFESIRKAKDQLFDYIEAFYNQRRRHSSIGYLSPAQHEKRYRATIELMAA